MAELRAGGLAVVIGCDLNSRPIIGHTVELVELVSSHSWVRSPGNPEFYNRDKARWLINKPGLTMTLSNGKKVMSYSVLLPEHLMPIGDEDFSHEKESENQLQNA